MNASFKPDETDTLTLQFAKSGWNKSIRYQVSGKIPVRNGSSHNYVVSGKWNETIQAYNEETGETITIFEPNAYPHNKEWQYNFTRFAINLNNGTERLRTKLPPTDSRFRPDQYAHERGDFDLATAEKLRLEEKQRTARKLLAEEGRDYQCKYFQQMYDQNGDIIYKMTRDYW